MSIHELTPLIDFSSNALDHFVCTACEHKEPIDSCPQKVTRVGLKTLSGVFSAAAKVFYIPISLKIGAKIGGVEGAILGGVCAFCNSKAFFILEMWAANGIINDSFGTKTSEEIAIRRKEANKGVVAVIVVSAIAIALFSQIPYALPAADYSKHYKVLAGTVSLIAGILIPTRSIQLSLEYLVKRASACKKNQDCLKIQQAMVALIQEKRAEYHSSSRNNQIKLYDELYKIGIGPQDHAKAVEYLQAVLPMDCEINPSYYEERWGLLGKTLGCVLTGIFEYAIAEYTFYKSKELVWNNNILGGVSALVATASTLYLYGKAIIFTNERVFKAVGNILSGRVVRSLEEKLHPVPNYVFKVEEAVTNLFALAPTLVIWGEFFNEPVWEHYFFLTSISVTIYLLLLTSSLDMVDGGTHGISKNIEKKKILKMDEMYQRLASGFEEVSQESFAQFAKGLPREIKAAVCAKGNLSLEHFDRCLESVAHIDLRSHELNQIDFA